MFDWLGGDWLGRGSYAAGSQDEWDNWDMADFDRLSNEGISEGGWDMDALGGLMGAQGGMGGGSGGKIPGYQVAQAPRLDNAQGTLQGLMNMVGTPPQQQNLGRAYANPYVTGLLQV